MDLAANRETDGGNLREGPLQPIRSGGVEMVSAVASRWQGLTRFIVQLRWLTEPGWIEFRFDRPACLVIADEIGGRCDFRLNPSTLGDGAFVGINHASHLAANTVFTVHSAEIRRATLVCCLAGEPSNEDEAIALAAISATPTRLMMRDRPLHDCAVLFGQQQASDPAEPFAGAIAQTVLMAWAAATVRRPSSPAPALSGVQLSSILNYIRDELEAPIAVAPLAECAAIEPTVFSKQFEEATGMSPQAWQMDVRVRNAQRLMIDDPNGSLDEFARLCGFADQSHFSRVFLKVAGMSPTEWLRRQT